MSIRHVVDIVTDATNDVVSVILVTIHVIINIIRFVFVIRAKTLRYTSPHIDRMHTVLYVSVCVCVCVCVLCVNDIDDQSAFRD